MLLLAVLALPRALALPLAPCADLSGVLAAGVDPGGVLVWEDPSGSGEPVVLPWAEACAVGDEQPPVAKILDPEDGLVLNGWKELAVRASVQDPDGGLGQCAWSVESVSGSYTIALPVIHGVSPNPRPTQPWVGVPRVCEGVLPMGNVPAGSYRLVVTATDQFGASGSASVDLRLNDAPSVALTAPGAGSVYLPGDAITVEVEAADDVDDLDGQDVYVELVGGVDVLGSSCRLGGTSRCTATLDAPDAIGEYTLTAWVGDHDGRTGRSGAVPLVVNDVPGVSVTVVTEEGWIEAGAPTDIAVQVTDAWAAMGDRVVLFGTFGAATWELGSCALGADGACWVSMTADDVGVWDLWAQYTDGFGEVGVSTPVTVLVNDTPNLTASALEDGGVVLPDATIGVDLTVIDANPDDGEVFAYVSDGGSSVASGPFVPDATGAIQVPVEIGAPGPYEVSFAFVDAHGLRVETPPVTVQANYAPEVTLTEPAGAMTVSWPAGDPDYPAVAFAFTTADADDAALTVTPTVTAPGYVTCDETPAAGVGSFSCQAWVEDLGAGSVTVSVAVEDDVESVSTSFTISLVDGVSYDYDGDGVLEAAGDCDPYDATVYGASGSIPAAPELCDLLDNDCDGGVNDGLPDEGGDTLETAAPLGGAVVVTTNGGSGVDVEDAGSLHVEGDVDWWYFEVGADGVDRQNASFTAMLSVPAGSDGSPAGTWEIEAWTGASAGRVGRGPDDAPTTSCTDTCTLSWRIEGDSEEVDELQWWIAVRATAWDPAMCSESATTYTLAIVD